MAEGIDQRELNQKIFDALGPAAAGFYQRSVLDVDGEVLTICVPEAIMIHGEKNHIDKVLGAVKDLGIKTVRYEDGGRRVLENTHMSRLLWEADRVWGEGGDSRSPSKLEQRVAKIEGMRNQLDSRHTFRDMLVSRHNGVAAGMAKSYCSKREILFPVLFLHGDSGLGKTYLVQAIGHRILDNEIAALTPGNRRKLKSRRPRLVYTTAGNLIRRTKQRFDTRTSDTQKEAAQRFLDGVYNANILILEDVQRFGLRNPGYTIEQAVEAIKEISSTPRNGIVIVTSQQKLDDVFDRPSLHQRELINLVSPLAVPIAPLSRVVTGRDSERAGIFYELLKRRLRGKDRTTVWRMAEDGEMSLPLEQALLSTDNYRAIGGLVEDVVWRRKKGRQNIYDAIISAARNRPQRDTDMHPGVEEMFNLAYGLARARRGGEFTSEQFRACYDADVAEIRQMAMAATVMGYKGDVSETDVGLRFGDDAIHAVRQFRGLVPEENRRDSSQSIFFRMYGTRPEDLP
ncbi:MAG: hypothetical protein JSW08_04010 [archaeon]|nr:MAG: hypothetical protein JSW08_04010 [archaeon]